MATIVVKKRTRPNANVSWSEWVDTTDAAPFVDTALVQYRLDEVVSVDMANFSDGNILGASSPNYVWSGTGIFDKLMMAVNGNVKAEYDNGRLKGADYAQVYLAGMQAAIAQSMQFLLQKQLTEAQTEVAQEQKALLLKQQLLVERQTKGFDDDAKQKLLKQTLDSWSVAYSVAQDANSIPDTIKVNVIDSVMKNAYEALGIAVTTNPIGEA